ncbi:MAG: hypothetical protein K2X50_00700 [Gammaproteobacteria bacterium]|nr:hypothetical protein [Gammaproteobacteria bacterium]
MFITLGIIAIVAGALIIAYHGFTYKKDEKIAQVGDLKVTASLKKSVYLSPTAGGVLIGVGILFMIIGSL